eukprot:187530-Amphidinium_carterae.1
MKMHPYKKIEQIKLSNVACFGFGAQLGDCRNDSDDWSRSGSFLVTESQRFFLQFPFAVSSKHMHARAIEHIRMA